MNGKGSKPRNCFSKQFKDNYDGINWGKQEIILKGDTFQVYRENWGWIVKSLNGKLCAQGLTKNSAIKSMERVLATYNKIAKMVDTFSNKR